MKPSAIVILVTVTLIGVGAAFMLVAKEQRKPWPKPTPPPPPSPIYQESRERVPTAEEIALQASTRNEVIEREIESALTSGDFHRREAAFTFLLPELIQVEPKRVVAMFERQTPGEGRETLRSGRQPLRLAPGGSAAGSLPRPPPNPSGAERCAKRELGTAGEPARQQ